MINQKNLDKNSLQFRYLLWLYKTTKEEVDRIDRKFTQLEIDKFMLNNLETALKAMPNQQRESLKRYLDEFIAYIEEKRKGAQKLKFEPSGDTKSGYKFIKLKLSSIENSIIRFLGKKSLSEIRLLYQQEMQRRILEERQHK